MFFVGYHGLRQALGPAVEDVLVPAASRKLPHPEHGDGRDVGLVLRAMSSAAMREDWSGDSARMPQRASPMVTKSPA
jgi:hypothetical protein